MSEQSRPVLHVDVRRPQRADARRNFDALLAAAREAFATKGVEASLEEIARQAGVGIGTLYRNFPTRQDLLNAVYFGEIEELCIAAEKAQDLPPWEALNSWLQAFVGYAATKRAIWESLNRETESFKTARAAMYAAGTPLFERAQAAGEARTDISFDDLLRMVSGLTAAGFTDQAQRNRVLNIALDGVRAR
ncbi:helix-turn-helix domain-containing protein [Kribbella sp. NPDC026611]|uniref:TetR/AcrR family transcriptional regulator n=1 Tax=Kribbella sp. NPDC026611 TaxID=3154911 RepID=UPI0033C01F1A